MRALARADREMRQIVHRLRDSHTRWSARAKYPTQPIAVAVAHYLGQHRTAQLLKRLASAGMLPHGVRL